MEVQGQVEIVRCDFCGTSQRLVDARAFLDQILLQVNAWVRQALPTGLDSAAVGQIDPIARHSVFSTTVRPKLTTEYTEYRFNCLNALSHPLAVLPSMTNRSIDTNMRPKDVFLFQAKVRSIMPLAVDDESRQLVAEIEGVSVAYAYLLNNIALMGELRPERYHLMSQNFEAAAKATEGLPRFPGLSDRLAGLSKLSRGLDHLGSARVPEALADFQEAERRLVNARNSASQSYDMAVLLQAIDRELSAARSATFMAEACREDPSGNPASTLARLQALLGLLNSLQDTSYPQWQASFRSPSHHEEILKSVAEIRRAQRGAPTLRIIPGSGTILFPFWAVDIPYTFQTGVLWKTQGVEVTEAMLVSATFPLDYQALSGTDPSTVLTDVFRARERTGFFDEAMKRISGRETSISGGGPVREAIQRAAPSPAGGLLVVPPLTTGEDASMLVQHYLIRSRQIDRTIDKKLRLSSPRVLGLVFAAGSPSHGSPNLLPGLRGLAPRSVGDLTVLSTIAL